MLVSIRCRLMFDFVVLVMMVSACLGMCMLMVLKNGLLMMLNLVLCSLVVRIDV